MSQQPPSLRPGFITTYLLPLLPDSVKRNVLLSGFVGAYAGYDPSDKRVVDSLNKVMNLAHSASGTALPMHLSHVIWQDNMGSTEWVTTMQSGLVDDTELADEARSLVQSLPDTAVYAGVDEMVNDFVALLRHCAPKKEYDLMLS